MSYRIVIGIISAIGLGVYYLFKNSKKEKVEIGRKKKDDEASNESNNFNLKIEETFLCPLGLEIMNDPVMTREGITYDRKNIENWLKDNDDCPLTKNKLNVNDLIKNIALKQAIDIYKRKNGYNI